MAEGRKAGSRSDYSDLIEDIMEDWLQLHLSYVNTRHFCRDHICHSEPLFHE